jgi:CheY-like chemotaxis protein
LRKRQQGRKKFLANIIFQAWQPDNFTKMSIKKKILIIDDEVFLANVLSEQLAQEGYVCDIAGDGREGLEKSLSINPDLIILDLIMPVMDGFTMIERLRADNRGKKIPVIVLSNINNAKTVEEMRSKGAQEYLVKVNNSLTDIVAAVSKLLK